MVLMHIFNELFFLNNIYHAEDLSKINLAFKSNGLNKDSV
jgi:hypothetical protein